jgi:hypothetical protein
MLLLNGNVVMVKNILSVGDTVRAIPGTVWHEMLGDIQLDVEASPRGENFLEISAPNTRITVTRTGAFILDPNVPAFH